jgi:hypothetical protein
LPPPPPSIIWCVCCDNQAAAPRSTTRCVWLAFFNKGLHNPASASNASKDVHSQILQTKAGLETQQTKVKTSCVWLAAHRITTKLCRAVIWINTSGSVW